MTDAPLDDIERELIRVSDQERLAEAVASRRRLRDLQERSEDLATLAGTLVDLAESRTAVTLTCHSGSQETGTVVAVGADHLVLDGQFGIRVLVALDGLATVRVGASDGRPAAGERPPQDHATLTGRLGGWLDEPPDLLVGLRGSAGTCRGRLLAVGEDVLSIRDDAGAPILVPVSAIESVATVPNPGRPLGAAD